MPTANVLLRHCLTHLHTFMTSTGTGWPWSSRRSQDCEEDAEKKFHRVSHRSRLEGAIRDNELTADALAADGAIRER